jgi:hypothetical protein
MKLRNILFFGLVVMTTLAFAGKKITPPEIIVINFGEKNAQFDESQFPDLNFYYIESIIAEKEVSGGTNAAMALTGGVVSSTMTGTPEFLVNWTNATDLVNHSMLFDKNGVCVYEATLSDNILNTQSPDKVSLKDGFKEFVEKEKEGKLKAKKEFEINKMKLGWKNDAMMNIKLPEDFEIVDKDGNKRMAKEIIETGKPIMVLFTHIPSNVDMESGKEADQSQKTGKQFFNDVAQAAAGEKWKSVLIQIEKELFEYDAREK